MPEPLPALLQRRGFVVVLCVLAPALASAQRPLPQRNLLVEVREVDADAADEAAGWSARTADAAGGRDRVSQRLLVLNGGSAQLHLTQARPIQTWQWGWGSDGAGLSATTQWLEAGRRLGVSVRWPGGNEPATVELRAEASRFEPGVAPGSAAPPARSEVQVLTVVQAPLGEWVTLAATREEAAGRSGTTYNSASASVRRTLLQMRISAQ